MQGRPTTASMDPTTIDRTASLRAYPTVSAAARMIGVSPSTLTRRSDCKPLNRGARDQVLRPSEVLRLGTEYRKRSLDEVAAGLISLAEAQGSDERARVEAEISAYLERGRDERASVDFLLEAKRWLPPGLYLQVERAVSSEESSQPSGIVGNEPAKPGRTAGAEKSRPRTQRASAGRRVAQARP